MNLPCAVGVVTSEGDNSPTGISYNSSTFLLLAAVVVVVVVGLVDITGLEGDLPPVPLTTPLLRLSDVGRGEEVMVGEEAGDMDEGGMSPPAKPETTFKTNTHHANLIHNYLLNIFFRDAINLAGFSQKSLFFKNNKRLIALSLFLILHL